MTASHAGLAAPGTGRLLVQLISPQKGRTVKIKAANLKPSSHPDWPVFGRLERGDALVLGARRRRW